MSLAELAERVNLSPTLHGTGLCACIHPSSTNPWPDRQFPDWQSPFVWSGSIFARRRVAQTSHISAHHIWNPSGPATDPPTQTMNRTKPKKPGAIPHQSLINPSSNSPQQQKTKKRALNPTSPTTPPVPVPTPFKPGHPMLRLVEGAPQGLQDVNLTASTAIGRLAPLERHMNPPQKKNHGAVGSLKRVFHQHHPPEFLRFECEFGGGSSNSDLVRRVGPEPRGFDGRKAGWASAYEQLSYNVWHLPMWTNTTKHEQGGL